MKYIESLKNLDFQEGITNEAKIRSRLEKFLEGKITTRELTEGLPYETLDKIVIILNKLINNMRDEHYYIKKPIDAKGNIDGTTAIFHGYPLKQGLFADILKITGPSNCLEKGSSALATEYIEIDGYFGDDFEGAVLTRSDWYKIILNCPELTAYINMLLTEEVKMSATSLDYFHRNLSNSQLSFFKRQSLGESSGTFVNTIKIHNPELITIESLVLNDCYFSELESIQEEDKKTYSLK